MARRWTSSLLPFFMPSQTPPSIACCREKAKRKEATSRYSRLTCSAFLTPYTPAGSSRALDVKLDEAEKQILTLLI
ncbi:MAG: hypothetical protein IMF07_02140 [Proteobacteria bacterium]|nr:hypothetical protein [Pseudomonadota bacterium]